MWRLYVSFDLSFPVDLHVWLLIFHLWELVLKVVDG